MDHDIGLEYGDIRDSDLDFVVIEYAFLDFVGLFVALDLMLSRYLSLEGEGLFVDIVMVIGAPLRAAIFLGVARHRYLGMALDLLGNLLCKYEPIGK